MNERIVSVVSEAAAALPEGYHPFHPVLTAHVHDEVAHWIARVKGPNGVIVAPGQSPDDALAQAVQKALEEFNG